MDLSVLFLGTGGSVPTAFRAPTSVLVRRGGDRLLFDCGEGTQRQLISSVGLLTLQELYITHFHADHYLGLPGMLKTFDLQGREGAIKVVGPRGLKDLVGVLRRIFGRLSYPLELVELSAGEIVDHGDYKVATFPTDHSVESLGYVLYEDERPGRFDQEKALRLGVAEGPDFGRLQRGEEVQGSDGTVTPEDVLDRPRVGRKLVLSGDTKPCEPTRIAAHGADLLVHDSTFGDDEVDRAAMTGHSTASQAAELAASTEAKMLALTHLSTRYFGRELAKEAKKVFDGVVVPNDFDYVEIPFPERGDPKLVRHS